MEGKEGKATRGYIKTDSGDTELNRQGQGEKTTSGWATGNRGPEIPRTGTLRATASLDMPLSSLSGQRAPHPHPANS